MKSAPLAESKVPRHVAVIMDGNGRWASQQGKPHLAGHRAGAETVRRLVEVCGDSDIEYLTLYAFSTENWSRPPAEVKGLMTLLDEFLRQRANDLHKNEIRLNVIGGLERLPSEVRRTLDRVVEDTQAHKRGTLTLALSYGSRDEITKAVRAIAEEVRNGSLDPDGISEATVANHLYTAELPDPDLLIRTAGEYRLSNFMLWQLSYAEFWITPTLWPDFSKEEFQQALRDYGSRQRRYGGRPCLNTA